MNKWQLEVGGAPPVWKGCFADAAGNVQNSIHPGRDWRATIITKRAQELAKRMSTRHNGK